MTPELYTSRLRLRAFRPSDRNTFATFVEDPAYRRYLGADHPDLDAFMANNLSPEEGREFSWVICSAGTDTPIGSVFLGIVEGTARAEAACLLSPVAWNHGYATEATRIVITFGFEHLGLEEVFARASAANAGSIRAMGKLGMHPDRAQARADEVYYAVCRDDWRAS